MSTNKTTNYQINQWETEDRVLRGKADTATTDSLGARLTDVEGKLFYTKLLDYISSKSGSQIDLDVSDLDLTKYDSLEIRLDPGLGASYTTGFYLRLLVWPKRGGTAGVHHTERCPQELIESCFYIHLRQCLCGSSDYTYVRPPRLPHPPVQPTAPKHICQAGTLRRPSHLPNIVGQGNITTIPSGTRVRVYRWKK